MIREKRPFVVRVFLDGKIWGSGMATFWQYVLASVATATTACFRILDLLVHSDNPQDNHNFRVLDLQVDTGNMHAVNYRNDTEQAKCLATDSSQIYCAIAKL